METMNWQLRDYGSMNDTAQSIYGTETYEKGFNWLYETCQDIEDWGCGMAWGKRYVPEGKGYKGIDGSPSAVRFADVIGDLRFYTSDVDGIFMRHILEHNPNWDMILGNMMGSFRKRLVLIFFTPFSSYTHPLVASGLYDFSFRKEDITDFFHGFTWHEENLQTDTQYQHEHIFYVERCA
jgi:hypothetical protein